MTKGLFVNPTTDEIVERDLTNDEILAITENENDKKQRLLLEAQNNRRNAYQLEADPIFFKWQRNEATEETWLQKVQEIKSRFPDPT